MLFRCVFSIINICFFVSFNDFFLQNSKSNLFEQILGLAIVVCSWLLHFKSNDYGPLMGNQWFTAPVILIISGLNL